MHMWEEEIDRRDWPVGRDGAVRVNGWYVSDDGTRVNRGDGGWIRLYRKPGGIR